METHKHNLYYMVGISVVYIMLQEQTFCIRIINRDRSLTHGPRAEISRAWCARARLGMPWCRNARNYIGRLAFSYLFRTIYVGQFWFSNHTTFIYYRYKLEYFTVIFIAVRKRDIVQFWWKFLLLNLVGHIPDRHAFSSGFKYV